MFQTIMYLNKIFCCCEKWNTLFCWNRIVILLEFLSIVKKISGCIITQRYSPISFIVFSPPFPVGRIRLPVRPRGIHSVSGVYYRTGSGVSPSWVISAFTSVHILYLHLTYVHCTLLLVTIRVYVHVYLVSCTPVRR